MGRFLKFLFGTFSIIIALFAVGIGFLKMNDEYRQKLFANFLNKISNPNNTVMMNIRCNQILKHSNVKGQVLEIGAGTGINFACLHNNTNIESYTGIEPNEKMYPYFYDFTNQWTIPYQIRLSNSSATDMYEIPSNSIDTAIMTLVLCSVPDPLPDKVLREIYRVLKPGGKLLFFEHITANYKTDPLSYGLQRVIEPVWAILGDGCRFKEITNYFDAMKNVYSKVDYQPSDIPTPFFLVSNAVRGELIK